MEKDNNNNNKFSKPSVSSLPPSGKHSVYSPLQSQSSSAAMIIKSESSSNSHDVNISTMPDNPPRRNLGHRRAHSEILTLPDHITTFDTDEDLFSMYLDMDKFNSSSTLQDNAAAAAVQVSVPRVRHNHSQSMDGIKPEMLVSAFEETSPSDAKKPHSADKLADLALVDPKRAKRILANRQSAARSKERKMRYIAELERKVQTLQTEATSLSAQLTLLQRDTTCLTAENSELRLRLQTMEQQVHLQDALNDALKEEIQHLKAVTGQNSGAVMNFPPSFGSNQQFYSQNQSMNTMLTAQQFQQLQIQSHTQQHQFQQQQLHHQQQQQEQHMAPSGDQKMTSSMSIKEHGSDGSKD